MSVIKVNKSQLESLTTELISKVSDTSDSILSVEESLKSIPSHKDSSSLVEKAKIIADSIGNVYTDLEHVSQNMNTYVKCIMEIDSENLTQDESDVEVPTTSVDTLTTAAQTSTEKVTWSTAGATATSLLSSGSYSNYSGSSSGNYTYSYSTGPSGTTVYNNNFSSSSLTSADYNVPAGGVYNYEGIEKYLEDIEGVTVTLPEGLGSVHSYMGWQCITSVSSRQYRLREAAGMNFDEEGFAKIGDRYVVATTTTFGNVGDFIDVYQEDGTVIKCVIGDIKSQSDAGCTEWGHNNGHCVVEFVVDKSSWYGSPMHVNPGTSTCHPEWNQNITKIVNKGNFFELIKTDAAKIDENDGTDNSESEVTTL